MPHQTTETERNHRTTWPPPGWPGCPGTGRYRMALRELHELPLPQVTKQVMRRVARDAQTLADVMAMTANLQLLFDKEISEGEGYNVHDLIDTIDRADDLTVIPGTAVNTSKEGKVEIIFIPVSRDPKWAGISEGLKRLAGLTALVYSYNDTTVHGVIALPPAMLRKRPDEIENAPPSKVLPTTTEGRTLDRILRFHGAEPYYLTITSEQHAACTLGAATGPSTEGNTDLESPQLPPLDSEAVWEWRN